MTARIWTSEETKETIAALVAAEYSINKSESGEHIRIYASEEEMLLGVNAVFYAMAKGNTGFWLIRYKPELFED